MWDDLIQNIQSYYQSFVALMPKLGLALLVLTVLLFLANLVRRLSHKRLDNRMDDPLLAKFIANMVGSAVVIFALFLALRIVGLGGIAVGLLSTAGVGAFVLGFAFKDIGENFLAGVVLAFKRPFRVGDTVELTGLKGKVLALNLRDTQIKTVDGKDIFIPNSNVVKNPVINYTLDGFLREDFTIGLDYDSDMEKVVGIMQKVLDDNPHVIHDEPRKPDVVYGELASSTLNVQSRYWIDTFSTKVPALKLKMQLINQTLDALNSKGFYLPSNIVEVKAYRDTQLPVGLPAEDSKSE
ncbi:MAG: mechanosensitive ion channel [Bacteroidetes bacterium]|nr:mechanosensitive ion channel [Bacteroidota bacterium]